MRILILSCSTGGGHNAAGYAVKEELSARGHTVELFDPYKLTGTGMESAIGGVYVKIAQKVPALFGLIYAAGELYRRLPIKSPVYWLNARMCGYMSKYLDKQAFDFVVMPHLFPAEILTAMKHKGLPVPRTLFLATDYTCIPFTEETDCDYYVIPSADCRNAFLRRGIPDEKLLPFGIPVSRTLSQGVAAQTGETKQILIAGGSMGAGCMYQVARKICSSLGRRKELRIVVICGSNEKMYQRLREEFSSNPRITLYRKTNQMARLLLESTVFISKPGGLSSTEAAVGRIPLIHVAPIPGCELYNMKFFAKRGMSLAVTQMEALLPAVEQLLDSEHAAYMRICQKKHIRTDATARICDFIEQQVTM